MDITLTTTDNDQPDASTVPAGHDWEEAGAAWSHRARDWACLFEHYATEAILAIFDRIGVGAGTSLLDIACGSGLALRIADARGADTAGIDAGAPLVDIARARTPSADLRVGTMFELPWGDETFDAVTAINGIWGGCEAARTRRTACSSPAAASGELLGRPEAARPAHGASPPLPGNHLPTTWRG